MSEKITSETVVTLSELAAVLGITSRRIRQLVEEGVIVPNGSNSYPLAGAVQAYTKFLSSKIPDEDDVKLEKTKKLAEVKLKAAKADRAKMEADEIKGTMHRAEDVRRITEDMLYAIRNGLSALPGRLAVDVAACGTAAEAFEVIKREVHRMMREFTDYSYDPKRYEEAVRDRLEWSAAQDRGDEDE